MNKLDIIKELYPEDLYGYAKGLTDGEVTILQNVRKVIEEKVRPVINEHWEKATFPFDEFYMIGKEGIMNSPLLFEGREGKQKPSELYNVFLYYELARFDASIATFYTVHGGLCYNTILLGGNEEQINKYAPKLASFEWQGCFGLTEPDHGSDIAGGLATTAEKRGDKWVLNGEKRWIGGAGTADVLPIFARSTEDNQIKCFIVRGGQEGLRVDKIENKVSLRMVQNGHIHLNNVEVDEADRLENINSFKDVANILIRTRADVAHIATGMTGGALEAALRYTKDRDQFGKKVASYQLIQEKLARMQAYTVAAIGYSARLAQMNEEGIFDMTHSSLAKMHNALNMRTVVSLAREVCGGNGITLESDVARFFADAEAIYTYEGSHEVNALIIGRVLTGIGAFV